MNAGRAGSGQGAGEQRPAGKAPAPGVRHGVVAAFDEAAGLGEVDDGDRHYRFHCTQIADGTRAIPVGTAVSFETAPARHGQWEAVDLRRRS